MVKIVGIGGSLRAGSYSQIALEIAARRVEVLGAEVEVLDLRQMNLPFCNGEDDYSDYPDVEKLQNAVKAADGLNFINARVSRQLERRTKKCARFDEF